MKNAPKPVSASQVIHSQVAFPGDANSVGIVFGGKILQMMDMVASIAARRHSNRRVVTVAVNLVRFFQPARVGHVLVIKASVNRVFRASMEVGVCVQAEDTQLNRIEKVARGYFTMVALDSDQKPIAVADVLSETAEQERRWHEAKARRQQVKNQNQNIDVLSS